MASFPSDDTHVMIVKMSSGATAPIVGRASDTEPGLASMIMQGAADDRNTESPSTLLGLSGPDQSQIGYAVWDDHAGNPA